jgi:hypothetical protein
MKNLNVTHEAFFRRIAQNIATDGRQIISVMGTKKLPPFAYTIGNQEKLLPELLLIGNFSATETQTVLNHFSNRMLMTKEPLPLGEMAFAGKAFMIYYCGPVAKSRYTFQAGQFYGNEDYKVQKIVVSDDRGRWPWDPLCHKAFKVPIVALTERSLIVR